MTVRKGDMIRIVRNNPQRLDALTRVVPVTIKGDGPFEVLDIIDGNVLFIDDTGEMQRVMTWYAEVVERLPPHDFKACLDLLYQKAYEYKSIVNDENVAYSAKRAAKMEVDRTYCRLVGNFLGHARIAVTNQHEVKHNDR